MRLEAAASGTDGQAYCICLEPPTQRCLSEWQAVLLLQWLQSQGPGLPEAVQPAAPSSRHLEGLSGECRQWLLCIPGRTEHNGSGLRGAAAQAEGEKSYVEQLKEALGTMQGSDPELTAVSESLV